jgi:hypothetical protein
MSETFFPVNSVDRDTAGKPHPKSISSIFFIEGVHSLCTDMAKADAGQTFIDPTMPVQGPLGGLCEKLISKNTS